MVISHSAREGGEFWKGGLRKVRTHDKRAGGHDRSGDTLESE